MIKISLYLKKNKKIGLKYFKATKGYISFLKFRAFQKISVFAVILNFVMGNDIAIVKSLGGVSLIQRMESDFFKETAFIDSKLSNGDALNIKNRAHLSLVYLDETIILTLLEETKLELVDTENTRTINVEYGTILHNVKSHPESSTFRIETPFSVATTRFGEFAAIVDPSNGADHFICQYGNLEVINLFSGRLIQIGPEQKVVSNGLGEIIKAPSFAREYPINPDNKPIDFSIKKIDDEVFEETVIFPNLEKKQIESSSQEQLVNISSVNNDNDIVNEPDSTIVSEEINNEANKSDEKKNEKSFLSKIFSFNGMVNTIFRVIFIYTFLLGP
ncbi:MAG: hypothetical protein CMG04_10835 [Candidatus Marinimicrobia bacterium]|nr:hypothetical protein [Candidatus Neomarinimicrobiota bacterium]